MQYVFTTLFMLTFCIMSKNTKRNPKNHTQLTRIFYKSRAEIEEKKLFRINADYNKETLRTITYLHLNTSSITFLKM